MIERVVLFNPCNRGDLFISKELVRYTIARLPHLAFSYAHRNPPELLKDIDGLEHWGPEKIATVAVGDSFKLLDDGKTLALSTWYGVSPTWHEGGVRGTGLTLNTLVELFRGHLREHFQLEITEPVEHFIPVINWERFDLEAARRRMAQIGEYRTRVLFCNGPILSGQSQVSDDTVRELLAALLDRFPDVLFICTSPFAANVPNVMRSSDILDTPAGACDLNETAYLGTLCDVIIGRCSGPFSFCYNTTILGDENKTLISLTNDERMAHWPGNVAAKMMSAPAVDLDGIYEVVARELAA